MNPAPKTKPFSALSAPQRAAALADAGTLAPLTPEPPHRGTLWIGRAKIHGRPALLALTDGRLRGGTVGVEEARLFTRLTAAVEGQKAAIVVCWDTGGVRVQEGPSALGAVAAVGVALTRLALLGVPVATVISGPRGCFGAPAVVAATAHMTILTANAHWGLTGPTLLESGQGPVEEAAGRAATSAAHRHRTGQATVVVPDSAAAIRATLGDFLAQPLRRVGPARFLDACVTRIDALAAALRADRSTAPVLDAAAQSRRPRDLVRHSFRGQWHSTGPEARSRHAHAAWGTFNQRPALAILVGPERSQTGIGIEDAGTVARMVRYAVEHSTAEPAPILTFLFCRGHANDVREERAGLPAALAECLKSLVAARLMGHPLVSVLGGGAYGAAYLSLAAPSHRILAIRGTTVAPMAPRVLAAFRRLRGVRNDPETPQNLAQLIPEIRIVESVVRLPRALNDACAGAMREARLEGKPPARLSTAASVPRRPRRG